MPFAPLQWLYGLYDRRLQAALPESTELPKHVGVITDGNRRWAKEFGATTADGHRAGADKIVEFIGWCAELEIEVITLYVLSKENLSRSPEEVAALGVIIGDLTERIAERGDCVIHLVGDLAVVPSALRERLAAAAAHSATYPNAKVRINIAVGYGGRQEIVNAVQTLLREFQEREQSLAQAIDAMSEEGISAHLYTKGVPDPDLIIRSSGEQRLSGFLVWQSAYSEFYFCEAHWPAFRRTDFLRALRDFAQRNRRYGL